MSSMNKIIYEKHLTLWVHSNDSINEVVFLEKNKRCEMGEMEATDTEC